MDRTRGHHGWCDCDAESQGVTRGAGTPAEPQLRGLRQSALPGIRGAGALRREPSQEQLHPGEMSRGGRVRPADPRLTAGTGRGLAGCWLGNWKSLYVSRHTVHTCTHCTYMHTCRRAQQMHTHTLTRHSPVEIGAAPDGVVREVLLSLLVPEVLQRVRPQDVTHGPVGGGLFESV